MTTTTTDVTERPGSIITGLLDGIQAVQEATTGRRIPNDTTRRPQGLRGGIAQLKGATDALYVLDREARGEPVQPGRALIFANGRR